MRITAMTIRSTLWRAAGAAVLAAAVVLPLTLPSTAHAWYWRGGWGVRYYVAPVVVAPPVYVAPPVVVVRPAYVPPPVVYVAPSPVLVAPIYP
jgi:hypothetical protein